tara:strand:+ start:930 stop:1178 length:249 start_codon:yes stop_codon:yes gene_type:complete
MKLFGQDKSKNEDDFPDIFETKLDYIIAKLEHMTDDRKTDDERRQMTDDIFKTFALGVSEEFTKINKKLDQISDELKVIQKK